MKKLILLASLFAAANAGASGDTGPWYQRFKAYSAPDIALDRFQNGELGVLQPGMQRVYLYTAWRAMSLAGTGKMSPGTEGGLARADGSAFGNGWADGATEAPSIDSWLRETRMTKEQTQFGACPSASDQFAIETISAINKRKDATAERVKAWIVAQELVSAACKAAADARYADKDALLKVVLPVPLATSEPAYWRQLRSYQRGAALFHAERYPEASAQFTQIGASTDHPMRDLGHYLALRSELRLAGKTLGHQASDAQREAAYAALDQRGRAILQDASLAPRHEATRATLRSARVSLTPYSALAELGKLLADPAADPFVDDRLGDWAVAMQQADAGPSGLKAINAARGQYDFVNWIENLRACAYPGYQENQKNEDEPCGDAARRALDAWQRTKSRPWLAASMMLAETLPPAMEKAAKAVQPAHPEYLTVRYHLARLYRLGGRSDDARAVSDAALKRSMSPGSRNLFREERFAVATSVPDAANYMLRVDVDSSEGADKPVQAINDDALHWVAYGMSAGDMADLARQPVLDGTIRARLAGGAWLRADLLGKHDIALAALDVLEPLVPALKKEIAAYRAAPSPSERRHLMLLTAMRFGLLPQLSESSEPIQAIAKDEVTASSWCSFKPEDDGGGRHVSLPWKLPPVPQLGDRDAATSELAKLAPLKTATGFVGDHVLARLKANPADPDLPWLLHVVVASTRGGCLDKDANRLSRDAFNALHKRFPRNEWTKKTPYFY